ncbi:MAG: hypothetical protein ACYTHM_15835 [Planctomycetota bacterium]|jgi:hypothetical protein
MEERDAQLRARFKEVKEGMSPAAVRRIMGVEPKALRPGFWGFELTRASDTATERDLILLVTFEGGKVTKTEVSYTCIYRVPRR